ncbi:unnamed protein product, partial [Phaeothamnion confervicola]
MKKAILFHKVRHSSEAARRYRHLRLPDLPAPPPPRLRGKVNIPRHAYREKRKAIANIHYSCMPETLGAFLWVYTVWDSSFAAGRFVDVALDGVGRPCQLAVFGDAQERCCARLTERLAADWRRAFSERLADGIQDIYDFFQSDERLYRHSALHRLLRHLELRMSYQLRGLFQATLGAWCQFITDNTPDKEEGLPEATGRTPLFDLRLVVAAVPDGSGHRVVMEPSHEEIEAACLRCLDTTVAATTSFTAIDSDLMSLLHLTPRPIFGLGAPADGGGGGGNHGSGHQGSRDGSSTGGGDECGGNRHRTGSSSGNIAGGGGAGGSAGNGGTGSIGPYADMEADLVASRELVRRRVRTAVAGPLKLAALYGRYCGLMGTDPAETADALVYADPPLSDAEFFAKVREYHDAAAAIERLSLDAECFKLARVATAAAKDALRRRAVAVRDALL